MSNPGVISIANVELLYNSTIQLDDRAYAFLQGLQLQGTGTTQSIVATEGTYNSGGNIINLSKSGQYYNGIDTGEQVKSYGWLLTVQVLLKYTDKTQPPPSKGPILSVVGSSNTVSLGIINNDPYQWTVQFSVIVPGGNYQFQIEFFDNLPKEMVDGFGLIAVNQVSFNFETPGGQTAVKSIQQGPSGLRVNSTGNLDSTWSLTDLKFVPYDTYMGSLASDSQTYTGTTQESELTDYTIFGGTGPADWQVIGVIYRSQKNVDNYVIGTINLFIRSSSDMASLAFLLPFFYLYILFEWYRNMNIPIGLSVAINILSYYILGLIIAFIVRKIKK